jgi:hypothetical protein
MVVEIQFTGEVSGADSFEFGKLCAAIHQANLGEVSEDRAEPQAGAKDGGLLIGIAIAGLAVDSICALFSILSYWCSSRANYTVDVSRGRYKVTFGNLSQKGLQEIVRQFEACNGSSDIKVRIARKK